MSVLVKGMEMPENCRECPFEKYYPGFDSTACMASLRVIAIGITAFDGRHSSCPLVALPDTHGRLVDADALIIDLMDRGLEGIQTDDWAEIQQTVMRQPTILEAEGE